MLNKKVLVNISVYFLFIYNSRVSCETNNNTFSLEEFKCSLPDVTSLDKELDLTRFRADFSKISEVKFPSLIGPLSEKLICKIKCIDGNWVGPLCSETEDGRFQPILRKCAYKKDHPLLSITFKNSSIIEPTWFPHGSLIVARCKVFGLYKLRGESTLRCENGVWTPKFPDCVPTTLITNFTDDAPPTILYTLTSGSAGVEPSGELYVFPDSSLRLDCVTPRTRGQPEWTWTQALGHYSADWSTDEAESGTHYRLALSKASARHSDHYTCTSPTGHTNTVTIRVVNVVCPPMNGSGAHLIVFSEGSRLGHSVHFSCQPGYHLEGDAVITCMGNSQWSNHLPRCVQTYCPLLHVGLHVTIEEYDRSAGGRALFACAAGHRLAGARHLDCDKHGNWSGGTPDCIPIYCPKPMVPAHGRLLTFISSQDNKYPVGDLASYSCDDGFQIVGESSILCTETGFWSHPPPFCLPPSEVRKADIIYMENTTLIHVEE